MELLACMPYLFKSILTDHFYCSIYWWFVDVECGNWRLVNQFLIQKKQHIGFAKHSTKFWGRILSAQICYQNLSFPSVLWNFTVNVCTNSAAREDLKSEKFLYILTVLPPELYFAIHELNVHSLRASYVFVHIKRRCKLMVWKLWRCNMSLSEWWQWMAMLIILTMLDFLNREVKTM